MNPSDPIDFASYLERLKAGASLDDIKPELFSKLCAKKHYLIECEPGYCVLRIANTCPYVHILRKLKDSMRKK